MKNTYIQALTQELKAKENPEDAVFMKKYVRNLFEFYGIKQGPRREIFKQFLRQHDLPVLAEVEGIVKQLWELPQREYQYCAIELLIKFKKQQNPEDLQLLEYLVTHKSWWDTVDAINSQLIGPFFKRFPELIVKNTGRWARSTNIWLQRSAIIFQLKYKKDTDTDLLLEHILHHTDSKEFFVQKGIGWALREYSKTNPQWVLDVVNNYVLPSLSKREALKWMKNKGIIE